MLSSSSVSGGGVARWESRMGNMSTTFPESESMSGRRGREEEEEEKKTKGKDANS